MMTAPITEIVGKCCQMRGKREMAGAGPDGTHITMIAADDHEPVYWYPVKTANGTDWIVGPTDQLTRQLAELSSHCQPPAAPSDLDEYAGRALIDVHFFICAVHIERADQYRREFWRLIQPMRNFLKTGPTDIQIGERLGDQGLALCFIALGEAMGFWQISHESARNRRASGSGGFLSVTGFKEIAP